MLRFARKPEEVMTNVVDRSLGMAIEEFESDVNDGTNFASFSFGKETLGCFGGRKELVLYELKRLEVAHKSEKVYMPTDLHFKLLDRAISGFCDTYNDTVGDLDKDDFEEYVIKNKRKDIQKVD